MRCNRIFVDQDLQVGVVCRLAADASHHVATVLRLKAGQQIDLFNGLGGQFKAEILTVKRRQVEVVPQAFLDQECESPLSIELVQGISKGQKMDITLQKAVELGVTTITPVLCERSMVKLDRSGQVKRQQHWQKIIISACEQCGRNQLPVLRSIQNLTQAINDLADNASRILLHPFADKSLSALEQKQQNLVLLIGPEGGFSDSEAGFAVRKGFQAVSTGPRILRTETAALATITACQVLWGDLSR